MGIKKVFLGWNHFFCICRGMKFAAQNSPLLNLFKIVNPQELIRCNFLFSSFKFFGQATWKLTPSLFCHPKTKSICSLSLGLSAPWQVTFSRYVYSNSKTWKVFWPLPPKKCLHSTLKILSIYSWLNLD